MMLVVPMRKFAPHSLVRGVWGVVGKGCGKGEGKVRFKESMGSHIEEFMELE